MIADNSLLMQIQLAAIGIVMVLGMFYLWRSLARLEDKVHQLLREPRRPFASKEDLPVNMAEADATAEMFMKQVFGESAEAPPFMMFMDSPPSEETCVNPSRSVIEEVEPEEPEEHESEAGTDAANPLSKSKLKRMNVDTLKSLCVERGLSSEGSKNVLIDRLLGLSRD
jgi:ABC-type nickel/cobalt efflux system permease component RcnA